jgi:16S rRNA (guanine527-N7)-methyltransferase
MQQLVEGSQALGLQLTAEQLTAFQQYYAELVTWNQQFNLTAITEYEQVQVRHFLDSLSCLQAPEVCQSLSQASSQVLDVGSGAGFPAIPLHIVCPTARVTLVEATGKKVAFLEHIIQVLNLPNITAVKGRAEDLAREDGHREQYDLVLARAVAELSVLAEYMLPFCRVGGWMVAQKGESGSAEAWASESAISLLGGELRRVQNLEVAGLPEERTLIVVQKLAPTLAKYPRRPGIPKKRPL